jgi:D-amino-acid dehydrogenase
MMPTADTVVIGAGLIGITTAYELQTRGHRTTLIEARAGVALETSRANGSMLTPSMADPWNAPGVHRDLAASLFDPAAAMKLRLAAVPSLVGWGSANTCRTRHSASAPADAR